MSGPGSEMSGSDGKSDRFVFVKSDDDCTESDICFKIVSGLSDRSPDTEVSSLRSMDSGNVDRDAAEVGATACRLKLRKAAESTEPEFNFGNSASATIDLSEVSTKGSCPLQIGISRRARQSSLSPVTVPLI